MKKTSQKMMLSIIESRIWIAFGAVSVVFTSYQIARVEASVSVLVSVFLGTWAMYYLQRYIPKKTFNLADKRERKHLLFLVLAVLFLISYLFQCSSLRIYAWMIAFAVPAILYSLPVQNKKGLFLGLRQVPYIKILVVALVWEFLVVLPWIEQGTFSDVPTYYALMMFLYLLAIIIPFDVRDMQVDQPSMRTVAQMLGSRKAYSLCFLFLLAGLGCNYLMYQTGTLSTSQCFWFVGVLMATGLILLKRPVSTSTLYFEGLLDGTLVLWCGVFLI